MSSSSQRGSLPASTATQMGLSSEQRVKSTITSRLRENEGKFIRQLEEKDQEILSLRKKLVELSNAQKRRRQSSAGATTTPRTNRRKWDQAARLEASLRAVSNEKLQLERKLQMASKSIEDLKTNPHLNEEMLKTIQYKSALCDKMEAKLHEAEEEVIKAKAENFRIVKTFANTRNQFQVIQQGFKAMDDQSSLVERVDSIEKLLREINLERGERESGFVSHVSSSSPSPERPKACNIIPTIKIDDSDSDLLSDIIEEPESFDSVLSQCESSPRICVALRDYVPPVPQAPNDHRGSSSNQLGFAQGQLIKVFGKASDKGFVVADIGGQKGLCPEDLISEVQPVTSSSVPWEYLPDNKSKIKVALYDYDPVEQSPNLDSHLELSFLAGDVLHIFGDMDKDGFYFAELNGRRGLIPSNFVISFLDYRVINKQI